MINNTTPKKKHIAVKIFAVIALLGLLLSILGFAFGGRPGTLRTRDGRMVYETTRTSYDLGAAPYWMADRYFSVVDGHSMFSWGRDYSYGDYYYNHGYEPVEDAQRVDGGTVQLGDLDMIGLDFSCGYVTVQPGETASLTVDGPLDADIYTNDGILQISTAGNTNNITTQFIDGRNHFFMNGEDITTYYTVTLPKNMVWLEAELGLGKMTIEGLSVDNLEVEAAIGEVDINNVTSTHGEFTCELGTINITGFTAESASLESQLGAIEFQGSVENYLDAQAELGAITITLPRAHEYGYTIENTLGAITVDGHTYAGITNHHTDGGDDLVLYLKTEMGAIEVKFK